jgi:hypothetical protein
MEYPEIIIARHRGNKSGNDHAWQLATVRRTRWIERNEKRITAPVYSNYDYCHPLSPMSEQYKATHKIGYFELTSIPSQHHASVSLGHAFVNFLPSVKPVMFPAK